MEASCTKKLTEPEPLLVADRLIPEPGAEPRIESELEPETEALAEPVPFVDADGGEVLTLADAVAEAATPPPMVDKVVHIDEAGAG